MSSSPSMPDRAEERMYVLGKHSVAARRWRSKLRWRYTGQYVVQQEHDHASPGVRALGPGRISVSHLRHRVLTRRALARSAASSHTIDAPLDSAERTRSIDEHRHRRPAAQARGRTWRPASTRRIV